MDKMDATNFDQLLDRYLHKQVTEEERIKLEAWLEVMKTDNSVPHDLTDEEEELLFQKITSRISGVDDIKAFKPAGRKKGLFINTYFRIAASMVMLLSVSAIIWYSFQHTSHTGIAIGNTIEKTILKDGSIVWLRKGSSISYSEDNTSHTRQVRFTGDALFEVAKDPSRPFIILTAGVTAKVLGTSFEIKSGADAIELKVLTGVVALSSPSDSSGVKITRNQQLIYKVNGAGPIQALSNSDLKSIPALTDYNMKFSDTPMSDVLTKIGKKFDVTIDISDRQINNCKITADFTDSGLDRTFEMLSSGLNMTYKIIEKKVIISGKGCQ